MRWLLVCLCLMLPAGLSAQTSQEDRGYIEGLLEDALSGPGRTVRIEGFAGALSSRATIERIVVTDPEGEWLTMSDVALQWTRSALLSGRIEIDEISVARIDLPRLPVPTEELPTPEARSAFALPELPVSINLAELSVGEVHLGAPLFGTEAVVAVTGAAALAGGAGNATLAVERVDAGGSLTLDGVYDNASRQLALVLDLQEPEDGIAVNLLDLPGRPSIEMTVQGDAPIDDFLAEITLATAGEERLAGTVQLSSEEERSRFRLDVSGDVAPVFAPEYEEFLGNEVQLLADGRREADGTLALSELLVTANALRLEGEAEIAPDGWPRRFALEGRIVPVEGDSVLLPVGGRLSVSRVDLTAGFDAARGDEWQLDALALGVEDLGFRADRLRLTGQGAIDRSARRVSGALAVEAAGIDPGNAPLRAAIGDDIAGALEFDWAPGAPLRLSNLDLSGADYGLTGGLSVEGVETLAIVVRPDLTLRADSLSRFAPLAGLDGLTGVAQVDITGKAEPLTGAFDIVIDGVTRGLVTGIERLDPLLGGVGALRLETVRDETGLRVDPLRITTDAARIDGQAVLATGSSTATITARIAETGDVVDGMSGPAELVIGLEQDGATWDIDAVGTLPGDAEMSFLGSVSGDGRDSLSAEGSLTAVVRSLAPYSALAGRDLSGGVTLTARGTGDLLARSFYVDAQGEARSPDVGVPMVERLLRGTTRFDLAAGRDETGTIRVDRLSVDGPGITASGEGTMGADGDTARFDLRLPDASAIMPRLSGVLALNGTARREAETVFFDVDGSGPGGAVIAVDGRIEGYGTDNQTASGQLEATVAQLAAYSDLAGRGLSGALDVTARGSGNLSNGSFSMVAEGATRALGIAVPAVEPLFRGTTRFDLVLDRDAAGTLRIGSATLDGPGLNAELSGSVNGAQDTLRFDLRLPNLGLVAPDFPGPAAVNGIARRNGGPWSLDASGSGPGGIRLTAGGTVARDASTLNVNLDGAAPLSIVNTFLRGQSLTGTATFDLSVNGPPRLTSLGGVVRTEDARFAYPAQQIAIGGIGGEIRLESGQAVVAMQGVPDEGGRLEITGPVSLASPFQSDLSIQLKGARLVRAPVFRAVASGTVTVTGPLRGGARIGGDLTLLETEIRIASTGPSYTVLEGLRHVQPPPDVQRTLLFAGLNGRGEEAAVGPAFPIDLGIRADNRLFVRGRGLDAELGGALRLTGTTNAIVPIGQFDLIRGRLDLLGRRLTLTRGSVSLRGDFDPFMSFEATSTVEDTEITIRLEGLAEAPELTVDSNPELPQDEALSFFLFGRSVTNISPLQAVQLAAAVRTLSGRGGPGFTEQLRTGLGVDDLDIGTDESGTAQARIGAYVSDNIYTDVTVNTEGESQINLNLDLTPSVTVRGRLGSDGDSGLGIFFERDY